MKELILALDWLDGPILAERDEKGRYTTGIKVIDEGKICRQLDAKIYNLYDNENVYDSNGVPRSINQKKKDRDKAEMLNLIDSLKKRLAEINDGSFVVVDKVRGEYK